MKLKVEHWVWSLRPIDVPGLLALYSVWAVTDAVLRKLPLPLGFTGGAVGRALPDTVMVAGPPPRPPWTW